MKAVFTLIAGLAGLSGLILLVVGLHAWNLLAFISGVISLAYSYAWSLVGSMWERIDSLERNLRRIE